MSRDDSVDSGNFQYAPSWVASAVTHALGLIVLALFAAAAEPQQRPITVLAEQAEVVEFDEPVLDPPVIDPPAFDQPLESTFDAAPVKLDTGTDNDWSQETVECCWRSRRAAGTATRPRRHLQLPERRRRQGTARRHRRTP